MVIITDNDSISRHYEDHHNNKATHRLKNATRRISWTFNGMKENPVSLKYLNISAGPAARSILAERGLNASDVSWLVGASGGPKWFVLYGLDTYLAGEFFQQKQEPLRLLGSSAGAWRMACYAHPDPLLALQRLAIRYSTQVYSAQPTAKEISAEARKMLAYMLHGDTADSAPSQLQLSDTVAHMTHHTRRRLYIIADRMRGWLRSERKLPRNSMLVAAALGNLASRRNLRWFFERVIFHNLEDQQSALTLTDLPTRYQLLHPDILTSALMASGSIPGVMEGVQGEGELLGQVLRDGGMTDYHLSLPYHTQPGLVLYPHFYSRVTPGWFDRFTPWRHANPAWFDNVVLLAPNRHFVSRLPYGKIPDRNDFRRMSDEDRVKYWQTSLEESRWLADDLATLVDAGPAISQYVQPFQITRVSHV